VFAIFERAVEMFPRTIWLGIFGLLVLVGSVTAFGPYKWSTSLISSSSYTMHWNLTQDTIYIGLRGNANGWLAVGFAQTASMAPADVVMGYFSGGTIHINDYYTTAHSTPTKDPNQDIEDKNGARNGNTLEVEFSRPLNTGDSRDRPVNPFAQFDLIYALANSLPASDTNFNRHDNQGTKKILLCQTCTPPAAPAPVQEISNGTTFIYVGWTAPSDGDAAITGYTLNYWRVSPDGEDVPFTNTTTSFGATLSFNVTGLRPSTRYRFTLRAINGVGTGLPSDPYIGFLRTRSAVPSPPSTPFGVSVTQTQATLSWAPAATTLEPTTGFTVEFKAAADPGNFVTGCTSSVPPCTISSLTPGTQYSFRVIASNIIGNSGPSPSLNFSTNDIGAVVVDVDDIIAPTISNVSSSSVRLTWPIPSFNGGAEILRYKIEVSNVTASPTPFASVYQDRHLTFLATGLTRRSRFQYRMSVINGVGESVSVNVGSVVQTPADPPAVPVSFSLLSYGRTWMSLGWSAPLDDGGSIVTNYTLKVGETVFSESLLLSFNATNLTPSTAYNVSVAANNDFGRGEPIVLQLETASCESDGHCSGRGTCNVSLSCDCEEGFFGDFCEQALLSSTIETGEFEFSTKQLIDEDCTLYWTLEPAQGRIRMAIEVKGAASGWAGVGIGKSMSDADIVIGRFLNGALTVGDYHSQSASTPNLDISSGGTDDILVFAGSQNGDTLVVKWNRAIDSVDSFDKGILSQDGLQDIIVAYNTESSILNYHSKHRHQLKVNWLTGEVVGGRSQSAIRIAHGVMMILGWFFLTVGAIVARYVRWIPKSGDLWFRIHRANQMFWFLVVLIAFILAWVMVQQSKAAHFGKVVHSLFGLVTTCLGVMQVAWALFRPDVQKDQKGRPLRKQACIRHFWQYSHYFLGPLAAILAVPTIFLGLYQLNAPTSAYIIYGVCIGILLLFAVTMEILRACGCVSPNGGSTTSKEELIDRSKK
jgi:hypothetical protein